MSCPPHRLMLVLISAIGPALLAADQPTAPPRYVTWPGDAIFYHVYVRSFADSNGDGQGDLPGLTSKLDYIASLGVDGLLLLPIFQNDHDDYGGYATTDFFHVEDDYGGDGAWDSFIAAARQRKLKVVLDLPISHVSDTHPWFRAARADLNAPQRQHFIWAGPPCPGGRSVFGGPAWNPLGPGPCYYSPYGPTVPGLNLRNPATAQIIFDAAAHWLRRGAAGFRLDSAKHIIQVDPDHPDRIEPSSPATHAFWRRFMETIKGIDPESVAICEVFDSNPTVIAPYYADGIDMAFDYPVYLGLVDAWRTGKTKNLASLIHATLAARPAGALGAVFTGNHDVPGAIIPPYGRLADLLGGDPARLRSGAMLLFSLPSTPFIYYGEEIGMRGATSVQDRHKRWSRNPMQWDNTHARGFTAGKPWAPMPRRPANVADQMGNPDSLLELYRRLIGIRKKSAALASGRYVEVPSGEEAVLAFIREAATERILVLSNFSAAPVELKLNLGRLKSPVRAVADRLSPTRSDHQMQPAAELKLRLGPYESRWLGLD